MAQNKASPSQQQELAELVRQFYELSDEAKTLVQKMSIEPSEVKRNELQQKLRANDDGRALIYEQMHGVWAQIK